MVLIVVVVVLIVTNSGVMNMVDCCVGCQMSEKERTLLWRWLPMGSVLTPLTASVLFLGVTCIECTLERRSFPANPH
jgi:hypothetical protein